MKHAIIFEMFGAESTEFDWLCVGETIRSGRRQTDLDIPQARYVDGNDWGQAGGLAK